MRTKLKADLTDRMHRKQPGKKVFIGGLVESDGEGMRRLIGTMDGAGSKTVSTVTFDSGIG